ncbi:hypothetical protein DICPUDRAFT_83062 [Dictyostelium purpureum]|uniref:tRNAHis guanylyltransferase catalytic domain-containing protein n=1 Tax=Dictyostelium purpureum TaxID=5786 RepID=F0ZYF3_DICPU|nr:uncharacterized protein DICPUDRAFT_83062 [Dictyostelium purpureum]EGC31035.1 hypothetical protein DICPUDRAFT_83062 [Dictyostelium purpureum]|eukprot:XP_003292446.1 hypothetical protein DICPUDRAFT_83062 [Dictyostelium purpureum]
MITNKNNKLLLGDRMKSYEKEFSYKIEKNQCFLIRLDGHGFSKFTKRFNKPWDLRIHNAMVKTSETLMTTFNPTCVYTFSDEITLCFPSVPEVEGELIPETIYSGKIQKLTTLAAGLASTVFYKSITNAEYDPEKDKDVIKLLEEATPYFDSRLFALPKNDEIVNNLYWRSVVDCRRNSIYGLGRKYFSDKQLFGLNTDIVKKKLLDEKGIDYNAEPGWYKYGVYFKKQKSNVTLISPYDKKEVTVLRTKLVNFSFNIGELDNNLNFITEKVLPEDYSLKFKEKTLETNEDNNIQV